MLYFILGIIAVLLFVLVLANDKAKEILKTLSKHALKIAIAITVFILIILVAYFFSEWLLKRLDKESAIVLMIILSIIVWVIYDQRKIRRNMRGNSEIKKRFKISYEWGWIPVGGLYLSATNNVESNLSPDITVFISLTGAAITIWLYFLLRRKLLSASKLSGQKALSSFIAGTVSLFGMLMLTGTILVILGKVLL